MNSYLSNINKWRYFIIIATLVFTGFMGKHAGELFANPDNDYRVFFNEDNPELKAYDFMQETYSNADNALFVVSAKNISVFNEKTLRAISWLTEEAWQLPHSSRVDSIANYQHTKATEDDLVVAELYEESSIFTRDSIAEIKQIILNEPTLVQRIIAKDGKATGVNVNFSMPQGKDITQAQMDIAIASRELREKFLEKFPGHEVHLTGLVMMSQAFADAGLSDASTLMPIMYLIVTVILALLLRSTVPVIGTLFVIFMSIAWSYGFAGLVGMKMTSPMFSIMNIVLTLAVADCIHLLMTFLQNMRQGSSKFDALSESIRRNGWPIFLTSITTAVGFLTLNFSETPPFRDLGNASAFGVMAAWFLSMVFLPAVLLALPVRVKAKEAKQMFSQRLMSGFAEFVIKHSKIILIAAIPISAALIYGLTLNKLDDNFVQYFDERIEFRTHTDAAAEKLTGVNTLQYSLPAKGPNGISDPIYLRTLERFVEWNRQQDVVLNVDSLNDTFKRLNKNMHGDDEAWNKVPENRELAAQYLLLYEMSLPYGLDLNNQIDVDKSATRVVVTVENTDNSEYLLLAEKGKQWLKENAPAYMHTVSASPTIMFAHVAKRNINTMLFGTGAALILISFLLIFALKSFKIGIISLVPNILPVLFAFGLFGFIVGKIGLAASIVAAICMGIVVDDTVHFLSKYLNARREKGMNAEDSIRYHLL